MPLVSVIFVFHQVTPYLRPALRSILAQTMTDFEVLVVDNGTGQGLSAFGDEGRDTRLRLISHPENRGIATAHNAAVALAQGEFIALMDYDDLSLPRRFERQLEALRCNPRLGLIFTHALEIDGAGQALRPGFTLRSTSEQYEFSAYSMPATTPTAFGPRELFSQLPYRAQYQSAADIDFTARSLELRPSLALPEVLLHYRRHRQQTTVLNRHNQELAANISRLLTARRRARRPEQLEPLVEELTDWLRSPPALAEGYAWFARRSLREGFPLLAAYFTRKWLSATHDPRAIARGFGFAVTVLNRAHDQRVNCARMLLTGPLRTHQLKRL